jgi:hypothetical protein
MEETISAAVLERWHNADNALRPSRRLALLSGHPRFGTTLLEQVLDSHPDIVTAEETHILHDEAYLPLIRDFSPNATVLEVLESVPASMIRQSREDYFRLAELFIGKAIGNKLLIDKNPALNVLIPAVARIFPEAMFLIAIRDPRDVCLSCFMQALSMNPVSSAYLTLEGTVTQYASVMGFWRAILPRLQNAWIEIRYEDVVADLETASRRALTFMKLNGTTRSCAFTNMRGTRRCVRRATPRLLNQSLKAQSGVGATIRNTSNRGWRNLSLSLKPTATNRQKRRARLSRPIPQAGPNLLHVPRSILASIRHLMEQFVIHYLSPQNRGLPQPKSRHKLSYIQQK